MQITVCDVCGKKNTLPLSLEYDRVYIGPDYDTPTERFDLCMNHLHGLLKWLIKDNNHIENKEIIKYIKRIQSVSSS